MRWTVGAKIGAGFAMVSAIFLIVGAVSYQSMNRLTDTNGWVQHTYQVLASLKGMLQGFTDAETGQRGYIITAQDSYLEPYRQGVAAAQKALSDVRELTQDNLEQQRNLDVLDPMVAQRLAALKDGIDTMRTKGADAARQWILNGQGKQEMDAIRAQVAILEKNEQTLLQARTAAAQNDAAYTRTTIVWGTLLAFALAGAAGFLIARVISKPLREISGVAERIASGDLTVGVSANRRGDEVGILARGFREMTENLRGQIRQLNEGITILSSSASQISSSTTQLASGAAETAAAVTEATTTVEEVKQTAQLSSQKARTVSETAAKNAQIAQTGITSVRDATSGMNRIRENMDSIADSMTRLSEQTQAIGQILATVEDLSAQSNLLAVNASIEAAKAGEHGKGFSVVAQEVRSLAEQSRQATSQVRNILGDIQKATGTAVMVTEQGGKAVEAGVRQSGQAGESIQTLSGSVTDAAQMATQIAASSQQQLVGIDQVATAMDNIRQASAQNSASARQLEAAAHNLNELGSKLKKTVERYKV